MKIKNMAATLLLVLCMQIGAMDESQLQKELDQKKSNKNLCKALKNFNVEKIEQLINDGADIFGGSFLYSLEGMATSFSIVLDLKKEDHVKIHKKFIKLIKIVSNRMDADGNTALHKAAILDLPNLVSLFIQEGAQIEQPNSYGYTPLFCSLFSFYWDKKMESPLVLLNSGVHVDENCLQKLQKHFSPSQIGDVEKVWLFLKATKDIKALDSIKKSASPLINNMIEYRKKNAPYLNRCNQKINQCKKEIEVLQILVQVLEKNKLTCKDTQQLKDQLAHKIIDLKHLHVQGEFLFDRYVAQQALKFGTSSKNQIERKSSLNMLFLSTKISGNVFQDVMQSYIVRMRAQKDKEQ